MKTITFEGSESIPGGVEHLLFRKGVAASIALSGPVKTLAIELETHDPGTAIIAQYVSYKLTYALED